MHAKKTVKEEHSESADQRQNDSGQIRKLCWGPSCPGMQLPLRFHEDPISSLHEVVTRQTNKVRQTNAG